MGLEETKGKKKYEHVKSADEIAMDKVLKKFRKMRKTSEIEKT